MTSDYSSIRNRHASPESASCAADTDDARDDAADEVALHVVFKVIGNLKEVLEFVKGAIHENDLGGVGGGAQSAGKSRHWPS